MLYTRFDNNSRKAFKQLANNLPGAELHFNILKKQENTDNKVQPFVTKYKKERDQFFLDNDFSKGKKVTSDKVHEIKKSKQEDEELHLSLGIR